MDEINFDRNMPIGLAMSLSMNEDALNYYLALDFKTKEDIQEFVKSSKNSEEARERIDIATKDLENNTIKFLM